MSHNFARRDYGRPVDVACVGDKYEDNLVEHATSHAGIFLYDRSAATWVLSSEDASIPCRERESAKGEYVESTRQCAVRAAREATDLALRTLDVDMLTFIGYNVVRELDDQSKTYTAFYMAKMDKVDEESYRVRWGPGEKETKFPLFLSTIDMNKHTIVREHQPVFLNAKMCLYA